MTKKQAISQFKKENPTWKNEFEASLDIMWDGFVGRLHTGAKISDHTYNKWGILPEEFLPKNVHFHIKKQFVLK